MARPAINAIVRFKAFVAKVSSGCEEWQSTLNQAGYGKFYFEGRQVVASRVSYLLFKGDIPRGGWVLHHCDNPKCVNPDHLYLGTAKENARDREARGRGMKGRRRHRPPHTAELISACRDLHVNGKSQQAIAKEFGISQPSVSRFIRGTIHPDKERKG